MLLPQRAELCSLRRTYSQSMLLRDRGRASPQLPLCTAKAVCQCTICLGHRERIKLCDVLHNAHSLHTACPAGPEQCAPHGVGTVDPRVKALVLARRTQPDGFSQCSHDECLILHSVRSAHNLTEIFGMVFLSLLGGHTFVFPQGCPQEIGPSNSDSRMAKSAGALYKHGQDVLSAGAE
jgi:hypothetical protein